MEKCKFCQEELPEDVTLCPACGKENKEEAPAEETPAEMTSAEEAPLEEAAVEEAPAEEAPTEEDAPKEPTAEIQPGITTVTPGKLALAIAAIVVLLAVLIALLVGGMQRTDAPSETTLPTDGAVVATFPPDGNPDDVTCKGSYTVTDEESRAQGSTVIATMNGASLSNAQLQVYYWMEVQSFLGNYGSYAAYFGLDYTQPLDTQLSVNEDGTTWQQYFLQLALDNWQQTQAMRLEAQKAGLEMGDEEMAYLDGLKNSIQITAETYGLSVEELLLLNVGPGAGLEEFTQYQEDYCLGIPYSTQVVDSMVPTAQQLDEYYTLHEVEFAEQGITRDARLVDVRHILVMPKGGTADEAGTVTYSDDEWAACKAEAQAILDAWLAGEATEDSFAALANEKSEDGGSNTNGGLYEGVPVGRMVEPFENWCFDTARVRGDTDLVQTTYGYHVMYFMESYPQWRSQWLSDEISVFLEKLLTDYPIAVDYSKIALGYIQLG